LSDPRIEGLAIATRADCLSDDVVDLLASISQEHFIWVELVIQSIHDRSRRWMNRHEDLKQTMEMIGRLQSRGVRVVAHLILGLPGETREDMVASVARVGAHMPWGIKLHLLHIIGKTSLAEWYQAHPFDMMGRGTYVELLADCLEILPPQITIHRLTGDAPRDRLIAPKWAVRKRLIFNDLDRTLKDRDSWQGAKWKGEEAPWAFNG
jgi:hypothetical protein